MKPNFFAAAHYRNTALLVITLLPITQGCAEASEFKDGTLCNNEEKSYFSCTIEGDKNEIVSLCGKTNSDNELSHLQYRFGTTKNIELEHPKETKNSTNKFNYTYYSRYQTERVMVSFKNEGYSYTLYDNYDGESGEGRREQGVSVANPKGDEVARLACADTHEARLTELATHIPCDPDDPQNLGSCPTSE